MHLPPFLPRAGIAAAVVLLLAQTAFARGPHLYGGEVNRETIHGKITDQDGQPLPARVELWYPEPGYITEEGGKPVPRREQTARQLFHADFANAKGWYAVTAFPGTWLVRVTAGPEYSTREFIVQVAERENDGQRHDIALTRLYNLRARGWYAIDVHHHSLHSDGMDTVEQIHAAARSVGLDAVALTDHNTVAHCAEWAEYSSADFLAVCGVEVSTSQPEALKPHQGHGHQNAIGVTALPGATDPDNPNWSGRYMYSSCADVQRAIDETHAMGGLYMINHAMQGRHRPTGSFMCWAGVQGFDAIEIHNGGYGAGPFTPFILGLNPGRIDYWNVDTFNTQVWFEFLNAGNKVAGWASSDSHDTLALSSTRGLHRWNNFTGNGRTYVRAAELSWPALREGLRRGHCFINNGVDGLLLFVDSNGQEPGDTVQVGADGMVPLTIEVLANRPLQAFADGIRIIQGGRVVQTIATEAGALTMRVQTEIQIAPGADTWLVVQAFGQWPSMALTNALYLDLAPHGAWGAAQWTPPPGAVTWNNPWPLVPEITVPDGPAQPPHPHPEAAIGYGRPLTREIAERLLREQYEIKGIEEDPTEALQALRLND
jgi:hypothetical protein